MSSARGLGVGVDRGGDDAAAAVAAAPGQPDGDHLRLAVLSVFLLDWFIDYHSLCAVCLIYVLSLLFVQPDGDRLRRHDTVTRG